MQAQMQMFRRHEIGTWQARCSALAEAEAKTRLCDDLAAFARFSQEYMDYFNGREFPNKTGPWLEGQLTDTLQDYWAPLARVAEQYQIREYWDELKDTQTCLAPEGIGLGFRDRLPKPLLYFDKIPAARCYPYTDTAYIAVPYHVPLTDSWTAVPHEMGHHLFWNAEFSAIPAPGPASRLPQEQSPLSKKVCDDLLASALAIDPASRPGSALLILLYGWLEEIFADVAGALLGGAVFVASTQALAVRQAPNAPASLNHDGAHPASWVRPLVSAYARELNVPGASSAGWNAFRAEWGPAPQETSIPARARPPLPSVASAAQPTAAPSEEPVKLDASAVEGGLKVVVTTLFGVLNQSWELRRCAAGGLSPFGHLLDSARTRFGDNAPLELLGPRILERQWTHTHQASAWCIGADHPLGAYHQATDFIKDHSHA